MIRYFAPILLLLTASVCAENKPAGHLIMVDPGHGGFDLGARMSSVNEKSLALSTSLLVRKYLKERGYRVIMSRMRDVFIPLATRAAVANKTRCHLFLSLHFNAAKNVTASGVEVFYYDSKDKYRSGASKKLARHIQNHMVERTKARDRGVKGGNFHVIRETNMPAVLIEGGFITHDKERDLLKAESYREKIAMAITDGVDAYFKS